MKIIRIVRMHFTEAGVEEFLRIFEQNREKIRDFPGCTQLDLLRDADEQNTFATVSHWDSEKHLEDYRKSELFGSVWGRVKTLMAERSEAFSLVKPG